MAKPILTQRMLKEHVSYNPETGEFVRIKKVGPTGKIGIINAVIKANGYRNITINGYEYKAHRMAFLFMTGNEPKCVDHINGIRHDNRWINLRPASQLENNRNRHISPKNTSGYRGVTWNKQRNKWQAAASINNKFKHIGLFENILDASKAYEEFVKVLHGDFYRNKNDYSV